MLFSKRISTHSNLFQTNQTQGEDGYFDGVISNDNGDATYKVDFDDGDVLDAAPRHDIRVLSGPQEILPNVSHETQETRVRKRAVFFALEPAGNDRGDVQLLDMLEKVRLHGVDRKRD